MKTFIAHYEHADGTTSSATIEAMTIQAAYATAIAEAPEGAFVRGVVKA